jgi:orotidine-5'-phosphate decarboxylase
MNFQDKLSHSIQKNQSYLCVGLDPDLSRMPQGITPTPVGVREFLFQIVKATTPFAVVYKPNLAFFLAMGLEGLRLLGELVDYCQERHPVILDAKFGDIGNTARKYAEFAFQILKADALTVNPYLGSDSLSPFLEDPKGYTFILGITSNPGAADLQKQILANQKVLFTHVGQLLESKFPSENWGWVAGATQVDEIRALRSVSQNRWLLIPGVGEQKGDLAAALNATRDATGKICGIINVSRSVLYASSGKDFAERAAGVCCQLVEKMRRVEAPDGR